MPFSLVWDPPTRIMTVTIGSLSNQTFYLSDEQLAIGSTFNAFGIATNYAGSNNPNLQGRLYVDDLTYTSGDTTTPLIRINRHTGVTRLVGSGGSAAINLDSYTISSNPANPPLENVLLPGNWSSISDQEGGGWSEVTSPLPGTQQLGETNSSGSKTIAPGKKINLGPIYDIASGTQDLSFSYSLAGSYIIKAGSVIFDGGLSLRVDKRTGNVSILNKEGLEFHVDGYVIQSDSGLLDPVAWHGLQEQSLTGWEAIASSDAGELSEVNLASGSMLSQLTGKFDLGAAYVGGLAGAENLRFIYSLAGGLEVLEGEVEYITTLVGDYNSDGTVDAADYTIWRNTLNSTTDLRADGNGNSVIDDGDYAEWKGNYGATETTGSGASTPVPEPGLWALVFSATIAFGLCSAIARHYRGRNSRGGTSL